jgi:integrase
MTRLGVCDKNMGVTAHGLRHGFAQRKYRQETGLLTPVEGGALNRIDRNTHKNAALTVSSALGHGRPHVTCAYYGSYGHALRNAPAFPLNHYGTQTIALNVPAAYRINRPAVAGNG